jgi:membrane glycosyltransferase
MAATSIEFTLWSLPLTLGFLVAIPFAVISADPALGERLTRSRLYAIPEEIDTPEIVVKAQAQPAASAEPVVQGAAA